MTRNYYEILEIEKNATQEEIKKAYRKLSLKWHPDKWSTKSESERKEAEEKFKEISKVYQILSDPETRNIYDIYGEDFDNFGSSGETSSSDVADEIKREYAEAEAKKQELKKQMLVVQMQSLSILIVVDEFMEYLWITENDLDSSLWTPYDNWKEKIRNLPFEEIDAFREKMISAIQEIGKKSREDEKNQEDNSRKDSSIKRIENLLAKRGIKVEELEPNNRNYKEVINSAKGDEVIDIEDRIKDDIVLKDKIKKGNNVSENNSQTEHTTNPIYAEPPSKGWWWGKK